MICDELFGKRSVLTACFVEFLHAYIYAFVAHNQNVLQLFVCFTTRHCRLLESFSAGFPEMHLDVVPCIAKRKTRLKCGSIMRGNLPRRAGICTICKSMISRVRVQIYLYEH